jgi:MYXO-CTERM domain-containing protein
MKALLRRSLVGTLGAVTLLFASSAFAEGEACFNDDDCPNPACGGDVCNWGKLAAKADGSKMFYCQPAGRDPKGQDGWCTTDANCKCKASGATCNTAVSHCTDTGTPAAPSGGSGAGGSAGTGGSATTAGTGTTTAGTGTTTAGTGSTSAPAKDDGGGCSVGGPTNQGTGLALALGIAGLGIAFARRRR